MTKLFNKAIEICVLSNYMLLQSIIAGVSLLNLQLQSSHRMPEIKQESPDDHLTRVRHAIKNFVDSATGPDDRAKRVEYLAGIMRSYQKSEREGYRAQPLPYIAVAAPPRA